MDEPSHARGVKMKNACLQCVVLLCIAIPSFAQAPILIGTDGSWNFGSVGHGGQTFYVFAVSPDTYYRVELRPSGSQDYDLYGHWDNSVNQSYGTNNHGFSCRTGTVSEHFGFMSNYAGRYYLSVYGFTGAGNYEIRVQTLSPAPQVSMISPSSSGLVWTAGESRTIQWSTTQEFDDFGIQISRDAGARWTEYIVLPQHKGGPGWELGTRSYTWTVTGPAAKRCRIRVQGMNYMYSEAGKDGSDEERKIPWTNPEDRVTSFPDFEIRTDVSLNRITIAGPSSLSSGSAQQFSCIAYMSDGTTQVVTDSTFWSENAPAASISGTGYLTTQQISSEQVCRITASYGGKTDTHNVTILPAGEKRIALSTTALYPTCPLGQSPAVAYFDAWNSGTGTLTYNVSVTQGATWMNVGPLAGDSTSASDGDTFTVTFNTASLTVGQYTGTIQVASGDATNSPQEIGVVLTIQAPAHPPAPTLSFPPNNKVFYPADGQQQFQWSPVSATPEVTGYHFYFEKVGGGYGDSHDDLSADTTSWTVNFPPDVVRGKYEWKVRARNGTDNWGPWSETRYVYFKLPEDVSTTVQNNVMSMEPINTCTGAYVYSREDISMPGRGLPFELARFYNSRAEGSTAMGAKWRHTYLVELSKDTTGAVTIHWANWSADYFTPVGGGSYSNRYGGYTGELTKQPDGTYTLCTKALVTYCFSATGALEQIDDRNGNSIRLVYTAGRLDQVIDTVGRTFQFTYNPEGHLIKVTGPLGREVQYGYDGSDNLTRFTDRLGQAMSYAYDGAHNLTEIHDRRGNRIVINAYDTQHRVTSQTNGRDYTWTYDYDPNGLTTETDPLGGTTTYEYNASSWIVRQTDARGYSTRYEYDDQGNRTAVTNARGYTTHYVYDGQGNVLTITDALGNVTAFEYNERNQVTLLRDPLGRETHYTYDIAGNLTDLMRPMNQVVNFESDAQGQLTRVSDPLGNVTENVYDAYGNLRFVTNALGQETELQYDVAGRLLKVTEPNGEELGFAYDDEDLLTHADDQEGQRIQYEYDANGNRTLVIPPKGATHQTTASWNTHNLVDSITDAYGNPVVHAYDELDRLAAVTDRRGKTFEYQYDAVGNRTKVIDALDAETSFTYDPNGNPTSITNANGHVTTFVYDELDRLWKIIDPLGNVTEYEYDNVGRLISAIDPNGNPTTYDYDDLDRFVQVADALSGTAEYTYDLNGNRTSIKDPNGHITTLEYDALNRMAKERDALGKTTEYTYDDVGDLVTRRDGRGNLTTYAYTPTHRLQTVTYPDASTVVFAYDAHGNPEAMTDGVGTTDWDYDNLDRITQVTDPFGNVVGYGYDAASNRNLIQYETGKVVDYTFNDNGRLETLTDWAGHTFTYHYDGAGNLTDLDYPNEAKEQRSYYANERLQTLTHVMPDASPFISYTYQYDPAGNIVGMDRDEQVSREFIPELTYYTYNAANEVLTAGDSSFSFDGAGNQVSENAPSEGDTVYEYDYENRLTTLDPPGADRLEFTYNGAGDRLKTFDNGTEKRYLLDRNKPLTDVLADMDAGNNPQQYYLYGINLVARVDTAGDIFYYHPDHLGSIMAVTDAASSMTAAFTYDEFGAVGGQTGSEEGPWRFCGAMGVQKATDSSWFVRARYLDVVTGRFLGRDPVLLLGSSQSLNRYPYVMNSPIVFTDASGEIPILLLPVATGILGGAVSGGWEVYTQYKETGSFGEIDYWEVAKRSQAGFAGGLVGGFAALTMPVTGGLGGAFAAGAAGAWVSSGTERIFYNLSNLELDALEGTTPESMAIEGLVGGGFGLLGEALPKLVTSNKPGYEGWMRAQAPSGAFVNNNVFLAKHLAMGTTEGLTSNVLKDWLLDERGRLVTGWTSIGTYLSVEVSSK